MAGQPCSAAGRAWPGAAAGRWRPARNRSPRNQLPPCRTAARHDHLAAPAGCV